MDERAAEAERQNPATQHYALHVR